MKNKLLFALILIIGLSITASAQCTDLEDCNSKLSIANQRVNKLLEIKRANEQTIEAQENALKAKNDAVTALESALLAKEALDKSRLEVIEAKNDRIKTLEKIKCSKGSFFLFIYRYKKCS